MNKAKTVATLLVLTCLFFAVFGFSSITNTFISRINVTHISENVVVTFEPTNVFPFTLLVTFLIATVDFQYFPTAGFVVIYLVLMFHHGRFTFPADLTSIGFTILGIIAYLLIGTISLIMKFWSYLQDTKNAGEIERIEKGRESQFFVSKISYLYPHFLFWPLSIPHTLITKLFYQIYNYILTRFSGRFANMVAKRREDIINAKTPVALRKNQDQHH